MFGPVKIKHFLYYYKYKIHPIYMLKTNRREMMVQHLILRRKTDERLYGCHHYDGERAWSKCR